MRHSSLLIGKTTTLTYPTSTIDPTNKKNLFLWKKSENASVSRFPHAPRIGSSITMMHFIKFFCCSHGASPRCIACVICASVWVGHVVAVGGRFLFAEGSVGGYEGFWYDIYLWCLLICVCFEINTDSNSTFWVSKSTFCISNFDVLCLKFDKSKIKTHSNDNILFYVNGLNNFVL